MVDYTCINKISSLEEMASAVVALNLCQDNCFKEVALHLEKPTYGFFTLGYSPVFVSDLEKNSVEQVKLWDIAIDEQCQRLTEGLLIPHQLKQKIYIWINRVALEYLSYGRRLEQFFGISRYSLMNILTKEDFKQLVTRLDEKKLALRLLEDERLTVLQRYHIACVYCQRLHISELWGRLTEEEKQCLTKRAKSGEYLNCVVWSRYMNLNQDSKMKELGSYLRRAANHAIHYGNLTALMECWEEFRENCESKLSQMLAYGWALESLKMWQKMVESDTKKALVLCNLPSLKCAITRCFSLSSYYSELMCFLLSQMNEKQQLKFFEEAFKCENDEDREDGDEKKDCKTVLEIFLDWPLQDLFLPTVNQLWGIIPKDKYVQCLLALVSKYTGNNKENSDYNYRSLLRVFWEETPEEYKQCVFQDRETDHSVVSKGEKLLAGLLERFPFQEKDETLFKQIFCYQPHEKRRFLVHSKGSKNICLLIIKKEKWSLLDWCLEECLPKEEIPDFRKEFIQSECVVKFCLDSTFKENREKLVEDLLNWSLNSYVEKTHYKMDLLRLRGDLYVKEMRKRKFGDVDGIIN